jgi:3-oxoacyl-[acyl-carrier-protein] synthase-3
MTQPAFIAGVGHYLPPRKVANAELPHPFNQEPELITRMTGVETRHWVDGRVYTSDLAAEAARSALVDARIDATELDCIVAATLSPDYAFPGIGVYTQTKLEQERIPAYDVRNQCSGFLYSLNVACAFVRAHVYRRVLLTCAEIHSHGMGRTEIHRHVSPLFGDGAGAVIVSDEERSGGGRFRVDYVKVGADGRGADRLRLRIWDISIEPSMDWTQVSDSTDVMWHPEMDGPFIFKNAVTGMTEAAKECLAALDLTVADLAYVLPHQANLRICRAVATALRLPPEKLLANIQRVGNTTAASIPILLSESVAEGRFRTGDRVLVLAYGSVLTWGAALLTAV